MTKHAILIGPTYVNQPESSQLPGTFTDIITTRNFLIDAMNHIPTNITLLTDEYMRYSPSMFKNYTEIINAVKHCKKYKTLLRYLDLSACIEFIMYINENFKNILQNNNYYIENYVRMLNICGMLYI